MMIIISRAKLISVFIFIFILSIINPIFGQSSSGFAKYLMNQKDYFRAITVYKKLLFESKEKMLHYKYSTQIAEAYRLSQKYKSSIYFYSDAIQNVSSAEEHANSLIGLGLNYYHMKIIPLAKNYFLKAADFDTTSKTKLFLGLMQMEQLNWLQANNIFSEIVSTNRNPKISEKARLLALKSNLGLNLPKKSPALAAILSSIIPGSGQIYTGHFFDGIQAMAYVGAFSLATYNAYRYDRDIKDSKAILLLSVAITGMFYSANILGAYKTAKFRNMRVKQNLMNEARSIIFEVSFLDF